ncbi:MAG: MaoC family dehydratase [Rhodobacteraceae bacterium]|nr:MaoC family dehydratase [Paracoccaceae bacterium]
MSRQLQPGRYTASDLRPGDWIACGTARITTREIAEFAEISGDRFEIHMSDTAARARGYPGQVAHGLLVMARVEGLVQGAAARVAVPDGCRRDWRFRQPILAGDRIKVSCVLSETALPASGDPAELRLMVETRNQHGVLVLTGETRLAIGL